MGKNTKGIVGIPKAIGLTDGPTSHGVSDPVPFSTNPAYQNLLVVVDKVKIPNTCANQLTPRISRNNTGVSSSDDHHNIQFDDDSGEIQSCNQIQSFAKTHGFCHFNIVRSFVYLRRRSNAAAIFPP
ncbi:hypothetical protein A2U01_0048993 [Trifolium medium]|uniref:Uncharacterized protein n=1 Tax=Trifolium medium TaxID=97028 RepID=A0A392QTT6_9FABA|nr:hypothetical protein [Trifolium medium]